jgi:hypothetical protein
MIARNAVTNRLELIDPSDLLSAEHLRQWRVERVEIPPPKKN